MADDTNTAEREAVARAIWALMREHEDRCDEELEDLSRYHPVWEYADAARASLAASAGSEPVAVAEVSCTHVHGWGTRWIVDADRKLNIPPLGTKLYARPPAPKQGQKDSSRLRKALIRAQQAINSMKVEAETAAQGDKRMMLEACETISNEGLQADMAIRDVLANRPSPPEGMAGWISVNERLPEPGQNVAFVVRANICGSFRLLNGRVLGGRFLPGEGFSIPGLCVDASHWMPLPAPPLPASEAKEL